MDSSYLPISDLINIGEFYKSWTSLVPEECKTMEEDAMKIIVNKLPGGNEEQIINSVIADTNLDSLLYDEEVTSLEEILTIVPDRDQTDRQLTTLECMQQQLDSLKSSNRTAKAVDRQTKPHVDLSHKNSVDESTVKSPFLNDPIMTVHVYRPLPSSTAPTAASEILFAIDQRFDVLGSQRLSDLKDYIQCPQDHVWLGDCSESLSDTTNHVVAMELYRSSYFFIENTFYNDLRDSNCKDLSACAREWARSSLSRSQELGDLRGAKMEEVCFNDISVRLGKCYLYLHQGNCEHLIVFSDLRLPSPLDCQDPARYPILTGRSKNTSIHCHVCIRFVGRWLVRGSALLPEDFCPLCDQCLRMLLYDKDGKKKYDDFSVYMYLGPESMIC